MGAVIVLLQRDYHGVDRPVTFSFSSNFIKSTSSIILYYVSMSEGITNVNVSSAALERINVIKYVPACRLNRSQTFSMLLVFEKYKQPHFNPVKNS